MRTLSRRTRLSAILFCAVTLFASPATRADEPPLLDRLGKECICQTLVCTCPKDLLAQTYDLIVNTHVDLDNCSAKVEKCESTCSLLVLDERARLEDKLDSWYRKWYVVAPLGIVAGFAAGIASGYSLTGK